MRLWPAGKNKFIDKLIMIRPFRLLSLSIASAIIFTQIIVMPMSIFFRGKVAYDLVITGVVCSFFVSLAICYLLVHLISHVHENEKRYRRLFEVESDAILLVDCETNRILDANVAASNLYGYTHEELLRLKATDVSAEPDETRQAMAAHQTRIPFRLLRKKNGTVFPVEIASSYFDYQGHMVNVAVFRDITERRQAEEALRESERKYRELVQKANSIILRWNTRGEITFLNDFGQKFFGYQENEILGRNVVGTITPDTESTGRNLRPLMESICQNPVAFEQNINENVLRDGRRVWIAWTNKAVFDVEGTLVEVLSIGADVTERKEAEEALRKSEERYHSLFEESKDAVFISTPAGRFIDINQAGIELFGYSSKVELLSADIERDFYVHLASRQELLKILDEQGYVKDYELLVKKKNGDILIVLETATAFYDEMGCVTSYRGMLRDITHQRKLEQQLMQAQKMEAVGQLAGGIAHDFNNILTAIMGYAHLLRMNLGGDERLEANVDQILQSVDRAAQLTHDLLAYSRKQILNPKAINLNNIVTGVEGMLSRLIGEDIEMRTVLTEKEIIVRADTGQMEQVLMNLVANARDAMPDGGKLLLSTDYVELDDDFIQAHGYGKPGAYALIVVSDTGIGMRQEEIDKIFEPFFTTKKVGKGTGLGLAMVYGIIKQHDGYITVDSEPDKGTTFRIYMPAAQSEEETPDKPANEPPPEQGTETVLVAEDDEKVRTLSEIVLSQNGYKVILAHDGQDAINKFVANKERIRLVILDMIMPKKSGKEVYDEIRKCRFSAAFPSLFFRVIPQV